MTRTQEQIVRECQARMAELEALAETSRMKHPCETCAHRSKMYKHHCAHPLVMGFGEDDFANYDWLVEKGFTEQPKPFTHANLCGPEKALWEPIVSEVSKLDRILDWLVRV